MRPGDTCGLRNIQSSIIPSDRFVCTDRLFKELSTQRSQVTLKFASKIAVAAKLFPLSIMDKLLH